MALGTTKQKFNLIQLCLYNVTCLRWNFKYHWEQRNETMVQKNTYKVSKKNKNEIQMEKMDSN